MYDEIRDKLMYDEIRDGAKGGGGREGAVAPPEFAKKIMYNILLL